MVITAVGIKGDRMLRSRNLENELNNLNNKINRLEILNDSLTTIAKRDRDITNPLEKVIPEQTKTVFKENKVAVQGDGTDVIYSEDDIAIENK